MRFYGLGGLIMQELGVAVTVMPGGEIYRARKMCLMQQNFLCRLVESSGSSCCEVQLLSGWHQQATLLELLINKNIWDSLSKVDQSIIINACQAAMQ